MRHEQRKSPRGGLRSHRGFVELVSYATNKLRQTPIIEFYPWTRPPATPKQESKPATQQRDLLRLARYYQSLLDSGKFQRRAALARHFGDRPGTCDLGAQLVQGLGSRRSLVGMRTELSCTFGVV